MEGGNLPPLFPVGSSKLFPAVDREVAVSQNRTTVEENKLAWLSNESFSERLIPQPTPIPQWYAEEIQIQRTNASQSSNLLLLSPSNADEDEEQEEEQNEKEDLEFMGKQGYDEYMESKDYKRKRSKERSHNRHQGKKEKKKKKLESKDMDRNKRMFGKDRWVDIEMKEYQFDARGDRDNLVYESLYRMNVPKFHRSRIRIIQNIGRRPFSNNVGSRWEEDGANMDEKVRTEGRYWSAKHASLDRRKDFKRVQIRTHLSKSKSMKSGSYSCGDFISLEDFNEEAESNSILREESWEDYVTRKTKEFNQLTRERPQDESLWINFVNFQDELIKAAAKKAAIQQAVEKKIAVLEKAMEIHPLSEDLCLLFLETSRKRDSVSTLISKWENCLKHNPRNYKLWREYLIFRKGEFSLFTESSLRKEYIRAIQTYSAANNLKEFTVDINGTNEDETEKNLVALFMDLCLFEWQTGHHEFAIGLLQAQIDYSLFAPNIEVNERSKKRLFKDFWDSGAPRIGEDGSTGWAEWLQKEEQFIHGPDEDMEDEKEVGGWTGWFEPPSKNVKFEEEQVFLLEGQVEEDENAEEQEIHEDEKYETMLLERLGLSLQSEQELEIKDPETWKCWSEEEQRRDSLQWLPVHSSNLKATHDEEILPEAGDDDEQLERAVLFEDVQECLFSLKTTDGQLELIHHFTDFCDGPSVQWYCSNSMKWKQRMASLENLYGSLLKQMESSNILEKLVGGAEWIFQSEERCKFLSNALILLRPHFLNSLLLQEKLLHVQAHRTAANDGARILAKKLLKSDRQAVLLMGAYARAEASVGNIETARKVFDTTLASLSSQSKDAQLHAPILYECYADFELSHVTSADMFESSVMHQKVLYIVSCLGSGISYSPFKANNPASSTQILKARHGFKEHLQISRRRRDQGQLTDQLRAMISCAAIFELLVDGFDAARSVFEESFAMGLPGKRQESLQFELLYCQYIRLMEHHKQYVKPALLRDMICRGLAQYPNNGQLLNAYIRCSSSTSCTNNLRRFFDDMLHKNPSIIIWLFAISIELKRPGSEARIHSLFERALETSNSQQSVVLWRCYISFELSVRGDTDAARRIYFRAIHACPWSKALWLDGFKKMSTVLSAKELADFQDIIREKELQLRTDVYEILLAKEDESS